MESRGVTAHYESPPLCQHGPTILFTPETHDEKSDSHSKVDLQNAYFACSAHRDKNLCSFRFPMKCMRSSSQYHSVFKPEMYQSNFKNAFEWPQKEREFCQECEQLRRVNSSEHMRCLQLHPNKLLHNLDDITLQQPSKLLIPANNNKSNAQYFFHDNFILYLSSMMHRWRISHVICLGCPRVVEAVHLSNWIKTRSAEESKPQIACVLLDLDMRLSQFYPENVFIPYNMFNSFFLTQDAGVKAFNAFLHSPLPTAKRLLFLCDPPFGGLLHLLASSVHSLISQAQAAGFHVFPIIVQNYFMERMFSRTLPEYRMLDYRVTYSNHRKLRHRQLSTVRMFTTVPPADVPPPSKTTYWFCEHCSCFSHKWNRHCPECGKCTTKHGKTYRHCRLCGKCVKPRRQHCFVLNLCPRDICSHSQCRDTSTE